MVEARRTGGRRDRAERVGDKRRAAPSSRQPLRDPADEQRGQDQSDPAHGHPHGPQPRVARCSPLGRGTESHDLGSGHGERREPGRGVRVEVAAEARAVPGAEEAVVGREPGMRKRPCEAHARDVLGADGIDGGQTNQPHEREQEQLVARPPPRQRCGHGKAAHEAAHRGPSRPRWASRQPSSTASIAARRRGCENAFARCVATTTPRRRPRRPRGSGLARSETKDRVPGRVVEVGGRRAAARRRRALVQYHRVRDEHDREAGRADPERPVDVLDVGEEPLVEQPGGLDGGTRDRHRGAVGAPGVLEPVEMIRRAMPAHAARVAETRAERRARVHHRQAALEHHLAREHTRVRPHRGRRLQRLGDPRHDDRVVVDEQHPVRAALQRPADADVVAAREAEVRPVADQLHAREVALDDGVGAVGRAVVDADRLDPRERGERARRVLAAVPVEDDGDEPHCSVRA